MCENFQSLPYMLLLSPIVEIIVYYVTYVAITEDNTFLLVRFVYIIITADGQ